MSSHFLRVLVIAAFFGLGTALHAQVTDELVEKLFNSEATVEEFTKVAEEAAKAGVPAQVLAEAKLVWGLRNAKTDFLTKILPELDAAAKNFNPEESVALGTADDLNGLINYIRALEAGRRGDEATLRKYIFEAFWLSPDQGQLFGNSIIQFRRDQKMAKITVDMKLPITTSKGEATTLADQLGQNKAILLDFWATWCGPCIELMPELRKKAELLKKHGIVVGGMNNEDEVKAEQVRTLKDMQMPWLVEPKGSVFSELLVVDTRPRMVLLSPEGKVLFNGHPEEASLWEALKKIDPAIEKPKSEPEPKK